MKSIGIDIGSHSIKVVELYSGSKGLSINALFTYRFKQSAQADHGLETIEFLRDLVSRYDETSTRFIIALRTDKVAIRSKFFPFAEKNKILKSLPFELEEDIPFSSENAIFDAKIIRFLGSGAETLAFAAPRHHIQSALQRASDCGFTPAVLSEESVAFANIFENWHETPASPVNREMLLETDEKPVKHLRIVLNMGHERTILTAYQGQQLVAIRSLLWGGKNIIDAVAKKYSLPVTEAAKEVESKAFILTTKQGASFDQVSFSDTIASAVRELTRDLQLSLMEIRAEHNAHFTDALISGGASQVINLGAFLTQMLDMPVNKLDTLARFQSSLVEKSPANEAIIGVALGLAIEGIKKPRNPALNFLRQDFAQENHRFNNFMEKWTPTLKVLGGFLITLFAYSMIRETVALDLADRTTEALKAQAKTSAGLKGRQASEASIKKFIREKKRVVTELKNLEGLTGMNSALDILNKLSTTAPSKGAIHLEMKNVSIEDDQVFIEGYVKSPKELSLLQLALANLSVSGKVSSQTASLPPVTDRTAFAFGFSVDREVVRK